MFISIELFIPIELWYHIYEYAYGTPKQIKYKVLTQLRQLSYQFTNRSYINNMISLLCQSKSFDKPNYTGVGRVFKGGADERKHWNDLWYIYLYKHFLTPSSAKRLKNSNIDVCSISRIFINFDRHGYLSTFLNMDSL